MREETVPAAAGLPRIAILMAVYEPRMDWLRAQLDSLSAQTCPNLTLYLRDDCSPNVPFEAIEAMARDCVRAFPCVVRRNERNLGSTGTFERLTREAEGDYFAYCDQDDIWLPEKLSTLRDAIAETGAGLVCSDMVIIDENGRQTANSITEIRRHHVFKSGAGLAQGLLIRNFVVGCTALVDAKLAHASLPFCPYMVHDHYLALWCAEAGTIVSLPDRLVRYRIHAGNQTPLMAGVTDRASYLEVRIRGLIRRLKWLRERFAGRGDIEREIDRALEWAEARERYFLGQRGAARTVWRLREMNPLTSLFEIVLARAPEGLFMRVIELQRRNLL